MMESHRVTPVSTRKPLKSTYRQPQHSYRHRDKKLYTPRARESRYRETRTDNPNSIGIEEQDNQRGAIQGAAER
jgi:hypothetical protein